MSLKYTGADIRKMYIDFFVEHGHTFVPSSSLVPGGDATLLFTNAGMVQFKDVFLGTDKRPYSRAANSQKCMRVAGKHNDLEDVGQDDTHHTFFEMLGNWSFGDYYKKEAIMWAWQLLTQVWKLPKENLWATCFKDDKGNIPTDEDAANYWRGQPGFNSEQVLYFGRKDNFWEMAETGPCGPCSEIHFDRGARYCDRSGEPGHVCRVNGDCKRFLELWNLVFIQYNRLGPDHLDPLPATHVDTGMGFERIVSVLQDVDSNYKTDLFMPMIETMRNLTGDSLEQVYANFTPYRVVADHVRAASFLIADGVTPGNTGRNYICRMIIRRAARFGSKLGLNEPFLADVASAVFETYGDFYPELKKHDQAIADHLTREEIRFARTVENGVAQLEGLLADVRKKGKTVLSGDLAFELYATYGLPFEITRDIAREQAMDVDEAGFRTAMDEHKLVSGSGKAMGMMGGDDVEVFTQTLRHLQEKGLMPAEGVQYDPYHAVSTETQLLAIFRDGAPVASANPGDVVEILLPKTGFYLESGGQVADTGSIRDAGGKWEIKVEDVRKPAAGVIVHQGEVVSGNPARGDDVLAHVDIERRHDIMRNHTATHLLHAELHNVLGGHARQAGSLVAPDRLRFDFTYPEALTPEQLDRIEIGVNNTILGDYPVMAQQKSREQAISEGAIALFGEKYGERVRTISIGTPEPFSFELCGGTHLEKTSDVGMFLIVSESSVAAGIRRIEAVTGRKAYELVRNRMGTLDQVASLLSGSVDGVVSKVESLLQELDGTRKQMGQLRSNLAFSAYKDHLEQIPTVAGIPVLAIEIPNADVETLRQMCDDFRQKYTSGVAVLASVSDGRPMLIAAITDDLVKRGLHAGEIVKSVASYLGGSGGGRPTLAQAGGKSAEHLGEALASVPLWVEKHLK